MLAPEGRPSRSALNRRGFLKAAFAAATGIVTKPAAAMVEALITRKMANQALSFVTGDQILDAKMFAIPYIPLMIPVSVRETFYGDGQLT